jgi:hypothetical protein
LYDYTETVVFRYGAWYKASNNIVFTKDILNILNTRPLTEVENAELFDENAELKIVEGKTKYKMEYSKINILFGKKEEYYDYSF